MDHNKDENDQLKNPTTNNKDGPATVPQGYRQTKNKKNNKKKRQSCSSTNRAWHRLHSIHYDVQHMVRPTLARIHAHLVEASSKNIDATLFLNQRCGTWYYPPSPPLSQQQQQQEQQQQEQQQHDKQDPPNHITDDSKPHRSLTTTPLVRTCHFKSTDGHINSWLFSLKRLNLTVLYAATKAADSSGVIILDASATKALPDSLSRTIPMWAAVWNRTAALYRQELEMDKDKDNTTVMDLVLKRRYFDLQTPADIVSRDEHDQMQALVEQRVEAFMASRAVVQPHRVAKALQSKPLTPFWITPRDDGDNDDNDDDDDAYKDDLCKAQLPTAVDLQHCCPLVCVNASRMLQEKKKEWMHGGGGFWYTPGAADDEESWARGLTSDLFWKHVDTIFAAAAEEEPQQHNEDNDNGMDPQTRTAATMRRNENAMDARIDGIVAQAQQRGDWEDATTATTMTLPFDTLGSTGLAIGSRRAGRPPECWDRFDAILNVTNTTYPDMTSSCHGDQDGRYYLQLPVQEGKRDRNEMEKWMAVGICFCVMHAQGGRRILIHCAQGKDRSVCVALAVVALFCDLRYPLIWKESFTQFSVQDVFRAAIRDKSTGNESSASDKDDCLQQASGMPAQAMHALLGREGRNRLLQAVHEHYCRDDPMKAVSEPSSSNELFPSPPLATKESLRIALHLIRQDREQAEPTRSTMQKLNRFFMSGSFEVS